MRSLRLAFPLVAFVVCLVIVGCGGGNVTKANYDKIKEGDSLADVEKVMGGKGTMPVMSASNDARNRSHRLWSPVAVYP